MHPPPFCFALFAIGFNLMQLELFPPPHIPLEDFFEAYGTCRKNKRGTANAVKFELDYESSLAVLCDEVNSGLYKPGRSIAFIIDKPVKREIFAADFRDRVIHHLIINKINHIFEREFIFDSYACREGKGTHFGIRRVDRFTACSSRACCIPKRIDGSSSTTMMLFLSLLIIFSPFQHNSRPFAGH